MKIKKQVKLVGKTNEVISHFGTPNNTGIRNNDMNIYEIKELTKKTAPYFFSKETMKFFKQTLKDFKVKKMPDGRYRILADSWGGTTLRYFNPANNELETK